jgi:hypothetical protein
MAIGADVKRLEFASYRGRAVSMLPAKQQLILADNRCVVPLSRRGRNRGNSGNSDNGVIRRGAALPSAGFSRVCHGVTTASYSPATVILWTPHLFANGNPVLPVCSQAAAGWR